MIPTVHYVGSEKHKHLIKALCLDRFAFKYTSGSRLDKLRLNGDIQNRLIIILDACALEMELLETLIPFFTREDQVLGIVVAGSDSCLKKLEETRFSYKVLSLIDLEKFEPKAIINILNSVKMQQVNFERMLAHHPSLYLKIEKHLKANPPLPIHEIQELHALLRVNNVSEYARQRGVSRSTVHRRLGKVCSKMNVENLVSLRMLAAKNEWI